MPLVVLWLGNAVYLGQQKQEWQQQTVEQERVVAVGGKVRSGCDLQMVQSKNTGNDNVGAKPEN